MSKAALLAGAMTLALAGVPALADGWGYGYGSGYYGGYGYNGRSYYDTVRWHVRQCQRHEQFHERLGQAHDDAHDDGFYGRDDHHELHEQLDEAHDAYHDNHPGAENCGYWYSQYRRMTDGYDYDRPRSSWSFWWHN